MEPLTGPLVLLALGVGLIVLEIFVPSAGLLSVLAMAAIVAAIVMAFAHSLVAGTLLLLVATVAVPVVIAAAIKWWPNTPVGRLILIKRPESEEEVLPESEEYRWRHEMVGKTGRAKSDLLPSGDVLIDGRVFDASSNGMAINAGTPVRVINVDTLRLIVRPVSEGERAAEPEQRDVLATPLESLGIDPFDDPLA